MHRCASLRGVQFPDRISFLRPCGRLGCAGYLYDQANRSALANRSRIRMNQSSVRSVRIGCHWIGSAQKGSFGQPRSRHARSSSPWMDIATRKVLQKPPAQVDFRWHRPAHGATAQGVFALHGGSCRSWALRLEPQPPLYERTGNVRECIAGPVRSVDQRVMGANASWAMLCPPSCSPRGTSRSNAYTVQV